MTPPPEKGTYYAHSLPPLSLDCSRPTIDRHRKLKCSQRVKQKQRSKLSFVAEMSFSISFQHCITCARWNIVTSPRFNLIYSEPTHTISKRCGGGRFSGYISSFLPHHVSNSQITLNTPHLVHSVKLSGISRGLYYGEGPRERGRCVPFFINRPQSPFSLLNHIILSFTSARSSFE